MRKKSFNNANVPHYADGKTPAIRPKAPRELPDWLKEERASKGQRLQFIYKYIRENWKDGDKLVITGTRPVFEYGTGKFIRNESNRFDGKTGAFQKLDTTHFPMVRILWDDGKKFLMGPVEFYYHAYTPDETIMTTENETEETK